MVLVCGRVLGGVREVGRPVYRKAAAPSTPALAAPWRQHKGASGIAHGYDMLFIFRQLEHGEDRSQQ